MSTLKRISPKRLQQPIANDLADFKVPYESGEVTEEFFKDRYLKLHNQSVGLNFRLGGRVYFRKV